MLPLRLRKIRGKEDGNTIPLSRDGGLDGNRPTLSRNFDLAERLKRCCGVVGEKKDATRGGTMDRVALLKAVILVNSAKKGSRFKSGQQRSTFEVEQ